MDEPTKLVLTRTIDKSVQDWMGDDECYPEGTVVYLYTGRTYGCISSRGVAVSLDPYGDQFFEVPKDSVDASDI